MYGCVLGEGEGVERMGVCVLGQAVVYIVSFDICVCVGGGGGGLSHPCRFVTYVCVWGGGCVCVCTLLCVCSVACNWNIEPLPCQPERADDEIWFWFWFCIWSCIL